MSVVVDVTSVDQFFAVVPRQADIIASPNPPPDDSNTSHLIAALGNIIINANVGLANSIPLSDPRLKGAIVAFWSSST